MDRRNFIKLTAITGTGAALASCGNPENTVIRFVPDDEMIPGIAAWKPSVCPLCGSGCGLNVRIMDADVEVVREGQAGVVRMPIAKKLEGHTSHPVSRGSICARGQAGIQVTYHPDRITQPLKRKGDRGKADYQAVTWDQAIAELAAQLDGLATAGDQKALAFIIGHRSTHRAALIEQFVEKFGAPAPIAYEFFGEDVLRRANGLSFGYEQLPTPDLARANFVISFGADFLGTWNSPVANGDAYGAMRRGRPGIRGQFVQVESHMTQTGANADQWVPAASGTEGVLALGFAHVIMHEKLRTADQAGHAGSLIAGWSGGLEEYGPENVSKITGVPAHRIERIAKQFATQRPAMAFAGGAPLAHTNGLFTAVAVNALNALVGNINEPGGIFFTPGGAPSARPAGAQKLDAFAAAANGGQAPKVVLIDGVNPVYSAPAAWKVKDAILKAPFIVSFGNFLDETTGLADLILPDHSALESWAEAMPESGSLVAVASVAPPAMKPLHQSRATSDVLLETGRKLQKPLALPWQNSEEMLKARIAPLAGGDADEAWSNIRKQGGWAGTAEGAKAPAKPAGSAAPMAYVEAKFDGDAQQFPYHFLPYASASFLDGSLAHLPWLQEMPDPISSAMWSSWVEINPETAIALGVAEKDIVKVESAHGSIETAVVVTPGLAPDVIAMPTGQGHESFTRYATNRGVNPIAILAAVAEPETGSLAWAATRVKITKVGDAVGVFDPRLILYAGSKYENPNEHER